MANAVYNMFFPSEDTNVRAVKEFLANKTRLYEVLEPTSLETMMHENDNNYHLIKGAVQSGKSRIIHALTLYNAVIMCRNTTLVLRNCTSDYEQMERGLCLFIENCADLRIPIFYVGDITRRRGTDILTNITPMCTAMANPALGCVIICLGNADHLRKLSDCMDKMERDGQPPKMMTIIDECDQLMYSEGQHYPQLLQSVMDRSDLVIGISATVFEPFCDEYERFHTASTYELMPSPDYKGIRHIMFRDLHPIDKKIKKERPDQHLEWDTDLPVVLDQLMTCQPYAMIHDDHHPIQMLIKTERLIVGMATLANTIIANPRWAEAFTIITYDGNHAVLFSKRLEGIRIRLPLTNKREKKQPNRQRHEFSNVGIQSVIQYLKQAGGARRFPRILIIAHGMVGRGINVVSSDFGWHCTHMYYRPATSTTVAEMIQSMRLCGVYQDNIPLTCYAERSIAENIYKGDRLQEDMLDRVYDKIDNMSLEQSMATERFHEAKIPARRLTGRGMLRLNQTKQETEDGGMLLSEFMKDRCMQDTMAEPPAPVTATIISTEDATEFQRLMDPKKGMFKKWSQVTNTSAISRFMKGGLDPAKIYNKAEMTKLCKDYDIELKNLTTARNTRTQSYGKILHKDEHQSYSLQLALVDAFYHYF